jgi:transposase
MRPYSQDLCKRIIEAPEAHEESQAEIAERFTVSLSFMAELRQLQLPVMPRKRKSTAP